MKAPNQGKGYAYHNNSSYYSRKQKTEEENDFSIIFSGKTASEMPVAPHRK